MGEVAGDVVLAHRGGIARPMKEQKASDPTDVRFLCPVAVMPCADRLADLVQELGNSRRCSIARGLMGWPLSAGSIHRTKRWIQLNPLAGEKRQQMAERVVRMRDRPILLALMPPSTGNGFDLRHTLGRIGNTHD